MLDVRPIAGKAAPHCGQAAGMRHRQPVDAGQAFRRYNARLDRDKPD
jgi:hypothetical protein